MSTTFFTIKRNDGDPLDYFETTLPTMAQKLEALKKHLVQHYDLNDLTDIEIWAAEHKVSARLTIAIEGPKNDDHGI